MTTASSKCTTSAMRVHGEEGRTLPRWITGAAALGLALAPAIAAIWTVPWFITQDSPAHVYNAEILARSFDPDSPFAGTFAIRWQPIPNWVGHALLAGLIRMIPAWTADRIMTSVTLVGFAASVFWLRQRIGRDDDVGGGRYLPAAALLAALLAMNMTWLFGFTSFTLGACLFPITLGFWWPRRDHLGAGGVAGLWMLLVLGYFCHLVSLGLTVVGLALLAVATPLPPSSAGGGEGFAGRVFRTRLVPLAASFLPLVPLGLVYLGLAHRGGPMHPLWKNLGNPLTLAGWKNQLTWADPITLMRKDALPFTERVSPLFVAFAPVVWLAAALIVWGGARFLGRIRGESSAAPSQRGWWVLAAVLTLGGLASPDTLGPEHGNYLPQRVVLCGLVALAIVVDIDLKRWSGRAAAAGLAAAVGLQSAIVCDYALYSDRTAGEVVRAGDAVGRGRRVVLLPATIRGRFRSNPLLHVDNWLGVGTDNIVWGDYETRHYYFPVQFRPGLDRPSPDDLERIISRDDPREAAGRAYDWERLLARHAGAIDMLVTYKDDPLLDAVTQRFFGIVESRGDVRILRRDRAHDISQSGSSPTGLADRREWSEGSK